MDPATTLNQASHILATDFNQFVPLLPSLLSQVSNADPVFRIHLLRLLASILIKIHTLHLADHVRFAVVAGCLEAVCFMMTDPHIGVQKEFVITMTNALPAIFYTLYL